MNKKILLVEDDEMIRELYSNEFIQAGFDVSSCSTGEKGLELLEDNQYDIMLLDIMIPGLNGLEVLKAIRKNHKTKDLKVALLTNLGSEKVITQGFELGAVGYLIKSSYNPDQLVQEVRKLIEA